MWKYGQNGKMGGVGGKGGKCRGRGKMEVIGYATGSWRPGIRYTGSLLPTQPSVRVSSPSKDSGSLPLDTKAGHKSPTSLHTPCDNMFVFGFVATGPGWNARPPMQQSPRGRFRTARAQRGHSARTAPIITVILQVPTLKTTHLRNHAQSIQNSKIQTSDACHGSQGPKFCPL